MKEEKPKIIGVYKELDLIAREIHLKLDGEDPAGEHEWYGTVTGKQEDMAEIVSIM